MTDEADARHAAPTPQPGLRGLRGFSDEGMRTALLMRPRWAGLEPAPWMAVVLLGVALLIDTFGLRLAVPGEATFDPSALPRALGLPTLCTLLALWLTARPGAPAGPMTVFTVMCGQALWFACVMLGFEIARAIGDRAGANWADTTAAGVLMTGMLVWFHAALVLLLWRAVDGPLQTRLLATALLVLPGAAVAWLDPFRPWQPTESAAAATPGEFRLTQDVFEAQGRALRNGLAALPAQRPGVIDVYAITYAPDADAAVFGRESAMVADVLQQRYQAHTLQLVSRRERQPRHAWATPINLRRAIQGVAARMDRDEDVLLLHLVSHGGAGGELASSFAPLEVDPMTPALLARWLDEAGVRYRVVSVSACYSGGWLQPLANDHALVMTAADAEHTSLGCGRGSRLTFFGQAMFDESLRQGLAFEGAFAAARASIERREREAGKDDGFSNPQLHLGPVIRDHLSRLDAQQPRRVAAPG